MVKILSNFDTEAPLKHYKEALQEHGVDRVLFIRRHKLYFFLNITLPLIIAGIFLVLGIGIIINHYSPVETSFGKTFLRGLEGVLGILIIIHLFFAVMQYFNHWLDYIIITPDTIKIYDQINLLSRSISTIDVAAIQSVRAKSHGLLNSTFNFGTINILLEGNDEGDGEINIRFVEAPEETKEKILEIVEIQEE